jgi:cobalt/nickel transport system ATP-binding protein
MSDTVLETIGLSYRYPDGRAALTDVSLRISRGARVALLGANGSGKTTLLLNLLGLLSPSSGEIRAFGEPLGRSGADLKQLRSRVGLVFQNPDSQLLSASVIEDVSYGPMNLGLEPGEVRDRVDAALAAVGMSEQSDVPAHALSFGQKKRVCIAGVLAMKPEVLLLDEPTAGLDAHSIEDLLAVLESLNERGMTVILSTHDIDLAYAWADRAEVLDRGRVVASCAAAEFVAAFPTFVRHGLSHPRVAEVFVTADRAGLIASGVSAPRTHDQLLDVLAAAGNAKVTRVFAPSSADIEEAS